VRHRALWLLPAVALLGARPSLAEEPPTVVAPLASSPIVLDGLLDDAVWKDAAVLALAQQAPRPGAPTPFATEVRVLVDSAAITLGFACADPDPRRLAVHTMQRDGGMDGDDSLTILLDPAGDGRNAYYFQVNAAGAQADGLVSGPESTSPDWDGVWDAKVGRSSAGWSAEVRIPAATLRFPEGRASWRFNVARYVPRERLTLRWSGTTLDAKLPDVSRAGLLTGVGVLKKGLGLELRPFGLFRRETDFVAGHTFTKGQLGLDASLNLTRELVGSATVNTDFAETEVDARQVNLTRFPLFFPEKRAFFLEGSNQLTFGLGLDVDFIPFYSRRVGLFRGRPVPILAGAKVLGRAGRFGVALLDVETKEAAGAARANSFAGRATYDVGGHLRVGTVVTHGEPSGRLDNTLAGVDAVWQTSRFLGGKDFFVGFWGARSWGDAGDGKRTGWGFKVDYPNDLWDVSLRFQEFGDALEPGLGFLPRPGTRFYRLGAAYQPRPSKQGPLAPVRQLFFELVPYVVTDLHGRTESWRVFMAPVNVRLESGDRFELNWAPEYERLVEPFEIAEGVVIPPGAYRFDRFRVEAQSAEHRSLQAGVTVWLGTFYSGHLTETYAYTSWTSRGGRLTLALDAYDDFGRLPQGSFTLRVWQLRGVLAFSPDLQLSTFVQYDSASREVGANTRLRWTIRPGTDLFVVWNRDAREPRELGGLQLRPRSEQIVVKLRATIRP